MIIPTSREIESTTIHGIPTRRCLIVQRSSGRHGDCHISSGTSSRGWSQIRSIPNVMSNHGVSRRITVRIKTSRLALYTVFWCWSSWVSIFTRRRTGFWVLKTPCHTCSIVSAFSTLSICTLIAELNATVTVCYAFRRGYTSSVLTGGFTVLGCGIEVLRKTDCPQTNTVLRANAGAAIITAATTGRPSLASGSCILLDAQLIDVTVEMILPATITPLPYSYA